MQVYKEAITVVMSPEERSAMMNNVATVFEFITEHFKGKDVETGTEDGKVMDAALALAEFYRRMKNDKYA